MASATARVAQVARTERLVLVNPEFDLLLACCADATALARTQRIQSLLSGQVDWNFLLQLALQHGVIPQLYRQLSQNVSYGEIHFLQGLRKRVRRQRASDALVVRHRTTRQMCRNRLA